MGKNKKRKMNEEGDAKHSPNTVFVSNLPYTFTHSHLEETFSEVGPIRRCYMVTKKGSNEHLGFGYVTFAVTEDAKRAVELKNGSSIGGRNLRVKSAMQRAPLEQRHPEWNKEVQSDGITETKSGEDSISSEAVDTEDVPKSQATAESPKQIEEPAPVKNVKPVKDVKPVKGVNPVRKVKPVKDMKAVKDVKPVKDAKPVEDVISVKDVKDEGSGSEKQRIARTVIFGGILNAKMAEHVHLIAKDCGTVLYVEHPLPKGELEHHGLSRDGCRVDASSVLFTSVKSARACVATLHQRKIDGGLVWARQLGGEGSKTQKWKLIIRNLPFEATLDDIKNLFSSSGFVWDVYVPRNSETGLAKGFGFVKFTSKQDAENAITKFNGGKIGKRTIAVDWAVPKKLYVTGALSAVSSDDEQETDGDLEDDSDSGDMKNENADNNEKTRVDPALHDTARIEEEDKAATLDFDVEAEVARKVLQNLISSSAKGNSHPRQDNAIDLTSKPSANSSDVTERLNPGNSQNTKMVISEGIEREEELQRTIFISYLPFDVTREEVKQRFSGFGEVESFIPNLNPVTKRPRGTGFLKFKSMEAVDAACLELWSGNEMQTRRYGLRMQLLGQKDLIEGR